MHRARLLIATLALSFPAAGLVRAQQPPAARPVVGHVGAGTAGTIGDVEAFFDRGWLASAGATFHASPSVPVGIRLDLGYARLPVIEQTLETGTFPDQVRVEDGHLALTTLILDVLYEFGEPGQMGGWFGAGVGAFHRRIEVTTEVPVGVLCPLDLGFPICPPASGFGQRVERDDQLTQIGFEFDAGISFPLTSKTGIYLEARYLTMRSDPATEIFPIVIGFRW
jgi:hypothetical protein